MISFIKRNWLLIVSAIYLIWPLDLISEVFGPIGLIDDAMLLVIAGAKAFYDYVIAPKEQKSKQTK